MKKILILSVLVLAAVTIHHYNDQEVNGRLQIDTPDFDNLFADAPLPTQPNPPPITNVVGQQADYPDSDIITVTIGTVSGGATCVRFNWLASGYAEGATIGEIMGTADYEENSEYEFNDHFPEDGTIYNFSLVRYCCSRGRYQLERGARGRQCIPVEIRLAQIWVQAF